MSTEASQLCRSCGATIWWAISAKGKSIPIDDPDGDGNLAVRRDEHGRLHARALVLTEEPGPDEHRARSHFATCKFADSHRKRGKA